MEYFPIQIFHHHLDGCFSLVFCPGAADARSKLFQCDHLVGTQERRGFELGEIFSCSLQI